MNSSVRVIAEFALLCCILSSAAPGISGETIYTNCTGLKFHFDGYTFLIDNVTGERVWSHCSFPSPLGDHALCGRPVYDGKYYLCDPDRLLDDVQGKLIFSTLSCLITWHSQFMSYTPFLTVRLPIF